MTPSQPSPTNLSDELSERVRFLVECAVKGDNPDIVCSAITAAYAEAIKSAVPEKYEMEGRGVSKVFGDGTGYYHDVGFNAAIDTFTTNLKNQGLLPNGKDE